MNTVIWELPVPPTGIIRGPFFEILPKRSCRIVFSIEGDGGHEKWLGLLFQSLETLKVTYLSSLGSIDRQLRKESYGKIIRIENSLWLAEIAGVSTEYHAQARDGIVKPEHLMICFDDGPCYEVICGAFRAESNLQSPAC